MDFKGQTDPRLAGLPGSLTASRCIRSVIGGGLLNRSLSPNLKTVFHKRETALI